MNGHIEKDFHIRSSHTIYTVNTFMKAWEHCDNQVVFLVSRYVKDVKILLARVFSKCNSTTTNIDGPIIKGFADAFESLLCYETRITDDKPVGKGITATTRANYVLP